MISSASSYAAAPDTVAGSVSSTGNSTALDAVEQRRFWVVAIAFLLAITLPYLWAWTTTPNGFSYGGLLYNPDDQNVHLAWARQALQGHFFFRDLFTTENLGSATSAGTATGEAPLFTNLFCYAIGLLSLITHLPLVVVYHALRLVFAFFALRWFFNLCALLTDDKRTRFLALLLVAFSGGAGWLAPLFPSRTFIDRPDGNLMMPEAWTFMSAFVFPLYIAAMALLIYVVWQVELARRGAGMKHAVFAFLAAFLLTNIHTYDAIPLGILLTLWSLKSAPFFSRPVEGVTIPARALWLAPLCAFAGIILPILYEFYVFKNSSEFQIKALTITTAPPILDVLLSYAPLLLLALVGGLAVWKLRRGRLMLAWFVITFACIYAPVSFSRKMIEGLHLPLCFLAALGLSTLLGKIPSPAPRRALAAISILILSLSSFNFAAWCLGNAQDNNAARASVLMPPVYLTGDDAAALQWLAANAPDNRAILCLPFIGNYAPRETGKNVYLGHWAETLKYGQKLDNTMRFFGLRGTMSTDEASAFLRDNKIGIVIVGSYEKQLGARLPLDLKVLHQIGNATIYAAPD